MTDNSDLRKGSILCGDGTRTFEQPSSNIYDATLYGAVSGKLTLAKLRYWMRFSKLVEDSENPCYSRKIGVVIVDPETGDLVSTGHNGPPEGCSPTDFPYYLQHVVWPQLTDEEKETAYTYAKLSDKLVKTKEWFSDSFANCNTCPRKLINAPSGKRLELCTCAHAEHNAVVTAHRSVVGCTMICHCGVPCIECSKTIVNAKIKTVVAIDNKNDYSPHSSRYILNSGNVKLVLVPAEAYEIR